MTALYCIWPCPENKNYEPIRKLEIHVIIRRGIEFNVHENLPYKSNKMSQQWQITVVTIREPIRRNYGNGIRFQVPGFAY